jgi:hypothetical protein
MRQLPIMLSNAFLLHLVILGWKLSGSSPFDVEIILSKCVIFSTFDEAKKGRIIAGVLRLISRSRLTGVCSDEDISLELGNEIETELVGMIKKCMNQQRGLWLNSQGVIKPGILEIRQRKIDSIKEAATKADQSRLKNDKKVTVTAARIAADIADIFPVMDNSRACYCSNGSINHDCFRTINLAEDDGWRGCTECEDFFVCKRVLCQKKLIDHIKFCLLKKAANTR